MAKMIPAQLPPGSDTPSSERRVFDALIHLPAHWTVLHGVHYASAGGRIGECDFVIIIPRQGIIVLEVKGGRVGRDANGWFSIDVSGKRHTITDPVKQARDAREQLARHLKEPRRAFAGAVVFPGGCAAEGTVGAASDVELIDGVMDLAKRLVRLAVDRGLMYAIDSRQVVEKLAPSFAVPTLSRTIADGELALLKLTQDQQGVLDLLEKNRRVAVVGGAGTGKTVLAVEKARRVASSGVRVLYLCPSGQLEHSVRDAAAGMFDVLTFHELCRTQARLASQPFSEGTDYDRELWEVQAPATLEAALDVTKTCWDAIVVDEGQDFHELWWDVLPKLLRDPREGELWIFYDPEQNVFHGDLRDEHLGRLGMSFANLRTNCRNTRQIATYAYAAVEKTLGLPEMLPEGTSVVVKRYRDDQQLLEHVRTAIHYFVQGQRVNTDDLVVLSPLGRNSPAIAKKRFGNYELVPYPDLPGANQIRFSSVRNFRGLESIAVILCDLPCCAPPPQMQRLIYVGASRAKHALIVIQRECQHEAARFVPRNTLRSTSGVPCHK